MTSRTGYSRWWGAASGLVAAAVAMGIGQLFAGFTVPAASPVVAVGSVAINHTPLAVKEWATSTFGTSDKTALIVGVLVVVFLYSMVVGVLAGASGPEELGAHRHTHLLPSVADLPSLLGVRTPAVSAS